MSPEQPLPAQPGAPTGPLAGLAGTLLPSVLRTLVPIIYALLVRKGLVEWSGLDEPLMVNIITAVLTTLFYALIRVAERYWDKIGWLLGYAARPALYVQGEITSVQQYTNGTGVTTTTVVTPAETADPKTEAGVMDRSFVVLCVIAGAVVLMLVFGMDWIDFNDNGR
jgi:hypothetical protein